jgi:putative phage-type endonuclease
MILNIVVNFRQLAILDKGDLKMEQGTNAWHEWRDRGVGSSEIAVIMEAEGAYQTRHQLFLKKTGQAKQETEKEQKSKDFIFQKGHRIEEMVRERYERKELISFSAALFQREDKEWQRASVDLCSHEKKIIKEVKYVSLEEFEAGLCPARYYPQIQWQYYVTGYHVDLVLASDYMWNEDKTEKIKIPTKEGFRTKEVSVPLDMEYIVKMEAECCKWWHEHILPKVPPALCDRDAVPLKDKEAQKLLKKYAANKKKIEKVAALEKENEELKKEIFKAVTHPIMIYGKIKIKISERKGSIDYKKIPSVSLMEEEELERYRGKSTMTKTITC